MVVSEVYCTDCMEYMRTVPDKFFDLALVDPPYGIGEDGRRNASRNHEGKATLYRPYTVMMPMPRTGSFSKS